MKRKNIIPSFLWITGLSASGKTTVAKALIAKLKELDIKAILLDGDELRAVLNKENVFEKKDRLQLAYTYAKLGKLFYDQGFTVVTATISMFEEVRQWNRENIPNYVEVYLNISEEERRRRNPKGLYTSESEKELVSLDEPGFEEPKSPHLMFSDCHNLSIDDMVTEIIKNM